MKSPYERLEKFENKHGEYCDLLNRAVEYSIIERKAPHEVEAHRQAEGLLRSHQMLVQQCCGYSVAKENIIRLLGEKLKTSNAITTQIYQDLLGEIRSI